MALDNKSKIPFRWLTFYAIAIVCLPLALFLFPWKELLTSPQPASTVQAPLTTEVEQPKEPPKVAAPTEPSDSATTSGASPTPDLDALQLADDQLGDVQELASDALNALKTNDLEKARPKVREARKTMHEVFDNIRTGVGGDVNLGILPKSNPLRAVGSARHNLAFARKSLHEASKNLGSAEQIPSARALLQEAITEMRNSSAKLSKSIRKLEAAKSDD